MEAQAESMAPYITSGTTLGRAPWVLQAQKSHLEGPESL